MARTAPAHRAPHPTRPGAPVSRAHPHVAQTRPGRARPAPQKQAPKGTPHRATKPQPWCLTWDPWPTYAPCGVGASLPTLERQASRATHSAGAVLGKAAQAASAPFRAASWVAHYWWVLLFGLVLLLVLLR
jgi:hypothetical protein